ncbi:MAG: S41 family peptidase [Planctomycetes bacterium]|nr:S41 family peptidase [Planctomycetota bacterium]
MSPRNTTILVMTASLSCLCYARVAHHRYAGWVAEAIGVVSRHALADVDERRLYEDSMSGMMKSLDLYSSYIPPDAFQPFQESLDQEFGGVGVVLDAKPDGEPLIVQSPVAGTPAYRAGMLAGDRILAIDGTPTPDLKRHEAAGLMRGKPGTSVRLLVLHTGADRPVELVIERAIIEVPSVLGDTRGPDGAWRYVLEPYPDIGYLRIVTFGEKTVEELRSALATLPERPRGLILDLRNNTGGLLTAAVEICDLFLDQGVIVTTRGRRSEIRRQYDATPGVSVDSDIPVIVLANRYSASASEIVAACLQDHRRARVVGERTWGKGTVQNVYPMEGGRSAVKLTVASYWRPSNENIDRREGVGDDAAWGVRPDSDCQVVLTDAQFTAVHEARARRDVLGSPAAPSTDPVATARSDASADAPPPLSESGPPPPETDLQLERAVKLLGR